MSPRPEGVREGEISPFTPEDDTQLWDGVQTLGRHWKRIAAEVEFSCPRTTREPRMRYDCMEGQERGELAMPLEREYIHVDQPSDGMLEAVFAAETGKDEEPARVRAPDPRSSDEEEDAPCYSPASAGFLAFSSSRIAELRAAGDQRPLPRVVRTIDGDWVSLEPKNRTQWAFPPPEASPRKKRGKSSFGPRR
jgi:hypothetical protein